MENTLTVVAQDTEILALSDEQITAEIKVYLGQIGQNIIEVGKRFIIMKGRIPHGEWQNWLKDNFQLSYATAARFIQCAKRFGNVVSIRGFNSTQMIAMLALPAEETEQFIEAKAAEGTPVEDMTVKQLREKVQQWKSRAEVNENALNEVRIDLQDARNAIAKVNNRAAQLASERDQARQALANQKPVIQAPADYEQIKREAARLREEKTSIERRLTSEKAELQRKLDSAVRNVEVPADYHANKKRLAELDTQITQLRQEISEHVTAEDYATVAQKLDTIYALITDVMNSRNAGRVMADYERNQPDRYHLLCASFTDFIRIMEME